MEVAVAAPEPEPVSEEDGAVEQEEEEGSVAPDNILDLGIEPDQSTLPDEPQADAPPAPETAAADVEPEPPGDPVTATSERIGSRSAIDCDEHSDCTGCCCARSARTPPRPS